jgi:hypothetical protein
MSSTPSLIAEKFHLTTTTHGTPLISAIKRYTRATGRKFGPKDPGVILLLGHGAGFCTSLFSLGRIKIYTMDSSAKEIWEPTIDDIFSIDDRHAKITGSPIIREAWALDAQNHGEAAILNGDVLVRNPGLFGMTYFQFNSRELS